MNPTEIKRRAAQLINFTSPSPYYITIVYVVLYQAISTLAVNSGQQPFIVDLQAFNAGNYESAVVFAPENMTASFTALLLAAEIVFIMLDFGYSSYGLHVAREQKSGFYDLMDGFLIFFRALILRIVRGIVLYIGFLLFIIPGIFLAYIYSMSPRVMLDHPQWSPFHCMRESRRIMLPNLKEFFFLRLSLIGWNIISVLPITSIIAKPYTELCQTEFYLRITGTTPNGVEEEIDEKPPWEY